MNVQIFVIRCIFYSNCKINLSNFNCCTHTPIKKPFRPRYFPVNFLRSLFKTQVPGALSKMFKVPINLNKNYVATDLGISVLSFLVLINLNRLLDYTVIHH